MKIDNAIKTVAGVPLSDGQKRADKTVAVNSNPAASADDIQFSTLSSQLHAIEGNLASGGFVDVARVEEIKQAISDGRFKVNPEVVADRLLETVRDLIQAQKGKAG
jgi:negative regulator of flagellin synthesis FlgM